MRIRPLGEKISCLCGATRNVEVGHVNGREEDTAQESLLDLPKLQRSIGYFPVTLFNRPIRASFPGVVRRVLREAYTYSFANEYGPCKRFLAV